MLWRLVQGAQQATFQVSKESMQPAVVIYSVPIMAVAAAGYTCLLASVGSCNNAFTAPAFAYLTVSPVAWRYDPHCCLSGLNEFNACINIVYTLHQPLHMCLCVKHPFIAAVVCMLVLVMTPKPSFVLCRGKPCNSAVLAPVDQSRNARGLPAFGGGYPLLWR